MLTQPITQRHFFEIFTASRIFFSNSQKAKLLKSPDSTRVDDVVLGVAALAATDEILVPRVDGVVLTRTPIDGTRKTTYFRHNLDDNQNCYIIRHKLLLCGIKTQAMEPTLSTVIAENLKAIIPEIIKGLTGEIKQIISNNILEYQVEEYQRNSLTKTLLHRVQPKKLLEFYQPLFIRNFNKRRPISANVRIPTNSVKELFKNKPCITLIGNAGSGKSTMIKYLFLNCIDSEFKVPIKVELRYLNDYSGNIIDFIKERILKINNIATSCIFRSC